MHARSSSLSGGLSRQPSSRGFGLLPDSFSARGFVFHSVVVQACFASALVWSLLAPSQGWAKLEQGGGGWLAFGDLRGYIEPCGCDPQTDLGGVRRLSALIARERALHPDLALFHLGNLLSTAHAGQAKLKNPLLIEALAHMRPLASLVNRLEWQAWSKVTKDVAPHPELARSWVLTNQPSASPAVSRPPKLAATKNPSECKTPSQSRPECSGLAVDRVDRGIRKVVKERGWQVFGLLEHPDLPDVAQAQVLEWIGQQIRKAKDDEISAVLLFSGRLSSLKRVLLGLGPKPVFEQVLWSNPEPVGSESPDMLGGLERREPGRLRVAMPEDQADVLVVPLGGQGVLRGGVLRQQQARSLKEIMAESSPSSSPSTLAKPSGLKPSQLGSAEPAEPAELFQGGTSPLMKPRDAYPVTWLDRGYEEGQGLADLLKRYQQGASQQFRTWAAERWQQRKTTQAKLNFVGSQACQGCHVEAFNVWKASKHARAWATLERVEKVENLACVSCHVVGIAYDDGFVSAKLTPHLRDVGCESCHGPGGEHVSNPVGKKPQLVPWQSDERKTLFGGHGEIFKTSAREVCTTCHHPPHTAQFSFDQYWPSIAHK